MREGGLGGIRGQEEEGRAEGGSEGVREWSLLVEV